MATDEGKFIDCPAGQWTNVVWTVFYVARYSVSIGEASAGWRWYSTLPPWGMQDTFSGELTMGFYGIYSSLWINPDRDVRAFVKPG